MTNIYIVEVGFPVIYRIMQIEKARCYIYIYLPIKTRNHPLFFLSPLIPKQLSCTPQSCLMSIVDNLQFEIIDFWVTDVDEGIIWETSKFGQCRLVIKSIKLLSLITLSWVNKLISSSNRFWHYCWKKLLSTYEINK